MTETITRFEELLRTVPPRLMDLSDDQAARKSAPDRWSKKELLGHLIDSAVNNQVRFVRAQSAPRVEFQRYEQEFWVTTQSYATESWPDVVNLWVLLNRHMLHVVKAMPAGVLPHQCVIAGYAEMSLEELVVDYVHHMEQHLTQLLG